ncbi:penicillin-binding protein [Dactylonectria macrodidyma]|uniref:Penicillin-binding protein n=1 Tax=Dactylonectria macrodidyma TaxID=307937 RepID=A0A9P9E8C5_9HYPO|nr:penicillin-binding protein [Dactylonectria macrodidyma]
MLLLPTPLIRVFTQAAYATIHRRYIHPRLHTKYSIGWDKPHRLLTKYAPFQEPPSASISVLHDGRVIYRNNFGYKDITAHKRPTSETLYGIGSLTKGLHMSLALQGDLEFLLPPSEMATTISNLETYLEDALLDPLGLVNTTSRPVLDDSSVHQLPRTLPFKAIIFESAGGKSLLRSNPIALDNSSDSSPFYGMGWIVTQIPRTVGLQGDNAELFTPDELPTLGLGLPPIFTYYHQSAGLGYFSALFTFPETLSGVVVLTNSIPLNNAADWIAQVVVSALFRFSNTADYVELAKESWNCKSANVANMKAQFEAIKRHHPSSPRPLATYTSTYHNNLRNFYTERDTQVYELRHLRNDSFEWALNLDTQARRAWFTNWDSEYFEVGFLFSEDGKVSSLERVKGEALFP